jgi:dihydrofolate reductase
MSVKITLWMALSLNAMAAREDQSEDFLSSTDWDLFVELVHAHDSLVWGRVTHELFIDQVRGLRPDLPVAVVTRNPEFAVDGDTARAASPKEALAELSARSAATALLAGGPHLNAAFVREQLVDEVVLALEPVIVARGLPLLIGDAPDLRLDLLAVDDKRGPTLRVHYRVASGSVD